LTTVVPIEQTKIGTYTLNQIIKKQELKPEINVIDRTNGKRSITIQADKLSSVALADISSAIDAIVEKYPLPMGMEYTSG
jgi:multidrug efflux pump subunit AcrB